MSLLFWKSLAGKFDAEVALQLSNDPAICGLINDLRECVINLGPGLTLSDATVHNEADAVYVSQQKAAQSRSMMKNRHLPFRTINQNNADHDAQMDVVQINPETSGQEMNEPPEHELVDTTNQQSSVQAESAITDVHPALSAAAEAETSSITNSDDTSETAEPPQSEKTLPDRGKYPTKRRQSILLPSRKRLTCRFFLQMPGSANRLTHW